MANNMTFAYFPGCSVAATNKAYDLSTRAVAKKLGIQMATGLKVFAM